MEVATGSANSRGSSKSRSRQPRLATLPSEASRVSPRAHHAERLVLRGVRSHPLYPRFEYKQALNSAI
jgi:hypothetical protein